MTQQPVPSEYLSIGYTLEAEAEIMRGRVICGSRRGYTKAEELSLPKICDAIARIHQGFNERGKPTLPCIVSEGHLIGRTGEEAYRERVFYCDFSQSPRIERLDNATFQESVREYARELGKEFNQTRMYIEMDGRVEVWKMRLM